MVMSLYTEATVILDVLTSGLAVTMSLYFVFEGSISKIPLVCQDLFFL